MKAVRSSAKPILALWALLTVFTVPAALAADCQAEEAGAGNSSLDCLKFRAEADTGETGDTGSTGPGGEGGGGGTSGTAAAGDGVAGPGGSGGPGGNGGGNGGGGGGGGSAGGSGPYSGATIEGGVNKSNSAATAGQTSLNSAEIAYGGGGGPDSASGAGRASGAASGGPGGTLQTLCLDCVAGVGNDGMVSVSAWSLQPAANSAPAKSETSSAMGLDPVTTMFLAGLFTLMWLGKVRGTFSAALSDLRRRGR